MSNEILQHNLNVHNANEVGKSIIDNCLDLVLFVEYHLILRKFTESWKWMRDFNTEFYYQK